MTTAPLCRFEIEVARLGLSESDWEGSAELKAWCHANKDTYYVPTSLLTAWGMSTIYDDAKPTVLVKDNSEAILDGERTDVGEEIHDEVQSAA